MQVNEIATVALATATHLARVVGPVPGPHYIVRTQT